MKFSTRFVVPNVSAEKIGVNLTKTYISNVVSQKPPYNFVVVDCADLGKPILMEVSEFDFLEDKIVFRGWLNYNYSNDPYLFKGSIELKPIS